MIKQKKLEVTRDIPPYCSQWCLKSGAVERDDRSRELPDPGTCDLFVLHQIKKRRKNRTHHIVQLRLMVCSHLDRILLVRVSLNIFQINKYHRHHTYTLLSIVRYIWNRRYIEGKVAAMYGCRSYYTHQRKVVEELKEIWKEALAQRASTLPDRVWVLLNGKL